MSSALPSNDECSFNFPSINMYTVPLSNHADLRVYSDTRPHNWKIADLQKGLILVYDGRETAGEGAGFGLPVLVCSDETYFSGTSRVYLSRNGSRLIIRKEFVMDKISRNSFRNVTLENRTARSFFAYLSSLYQKHSKFRFLKIKKLTGEIRIGTTFLEAAPLGKVLVTFTIDRHRILVKADFNHLKKDRIRGIFLLNEQGSKFFREYVDSQETRLTDEKIGAWDGLSAEWADLIDPQTRFGFRLRRLEGCVLRRGREFLENSLDWVGLDYEVSPNSAGLDYVIEILGA